MGILTMSTINAKTIVATSVPLITSNGRGTIAIPQMANVEAIDRSTTDESNSQTLGRVDHKF